MAFNNIISLFITDTLLIAGPLQQPEAGAHGREAEDVEESHEKDEEDAGDDVDGEGGDGEGDGCPAHHQHENSSLAQGWPPRNELV